MCARQLSLDSITTSQAVSVTCTRHCYGQQPAWKKTWVRKQTNARDHARHTTLWPPFPPTCKVVFSFDSGCLARFSHEDNFEYGGKGGHTIIHSSFFSSRLGDMMVFFKQVGWYDGSAASRLMFLYGVGSVAMNIRSTGVSTPATSYFMP